MFTQYSLKQAYQDISLTTVNCRCMIEIEWCVFVNILAFILVTDKESFIHACMNIFIKPKLTEKLFML